MAKIIKFVGAYLMWIVDLGLTFWLGFISRNVYLIIFALSYKGGEAVYPKLVYTQRVDFADKMFSILLGLAWLAFMIGTEVYFRNGAMNDDLLRRFARITGPVLLGIFSVDLILFWLQGVGGSSLLRWFILAAELGIGITLLVTAKSQSKQNPT
jgi:hypothetical protein